MVATAIEKISNDRKNEDVKNCKETILEAKDWSKKISNYSKKNPES